MEYLHSTPENIKKRPYWKWIWISIGCTIGIFILIYIWHEISSYIENRKIEACITECEKWGNKASIFKCQYCYPRKNILIEKPVIYLYPPKMQNVLVQLFYSGKIVADYPSYDTNIKWWNVTAFPDGKIINNADQKEYNSLFWEWVPEKSIIWSLNTGFVVSWKDTATFFQEKLPAFGLTPREYNDFIVYWYPRMKDNPYNLIYFAGKEYTDTAVLNIVPKPDAVLRLFMVYTPLKEKIQIQEPSIIPFTRTWFTIVEWWGMALE